jgi:hypothetical protein
MYAIAQCTSLTGQAVGGQAGVPDSVSDQRVRFSEDGTGTGVTCRAGRLTEQAELNSPGSLSRPLSIDRNPR